jgi:hypothetical protein
MIVLDISAFFAVLPSGLGAFTKWAELDIRLIR